MTVGTVFVTQRNVEVYTNHRSNRIISKIGRTQGVSLERFSLMSTLKTDFGISPRGDLEEKPTADLRQVRKVST